MPPPRCRGPKILKLYMIPEEIDLGSTLYMPGGYKGWLGGRRPQGRKPTPKPGRKKKGQERFVTSHQTRTVPQRCVQGRGDPCPSSQAPPQASKQDLDTDLGVALMRRGAGVMLPRILTRQAGRQASEQETDTEREREQPRQR